MSVNERSVAEILDEAEATGADILDPEEPDSTGSPLQSVSVNMSNRFIDRKEVEKLLAEAEERGYLRGRNENIRIMMENPRESLAAAEAAKRHDENELLILRTLRASKWHEI